MVQIIEFSSEALAHRSVETMGYSAYRVWIDVLCLVLEWDDEGGALPNLDYIASHTWHRRDVIEEIIDYLISIGALHVDSDDGIVKVYNWPLYRGRIVNEGKI